MYFKEQFSKYKLLILKAYILNFLCIRVHVLCMHSLCRAHHSRDANYGLPICKPIWYQLHHYDNFLPSLHYLLYLGKPAPCIIPAPIFSLLVQGHSQYPSILFKSPINNLFCSGSNCGAHRNRNTVALRFSNECSTNYTTLAFLPPLQHSFDRFSLFSLSWGEVGARSWKFQTFLTYFI